MIRIAFIICSLCGIACLSQVQPRTKRPLYFTPPNMISYFSLGYKDFIANLLWLRFLQDADFCSFEKGIPVYQGDKKTCSLGWSYRITDAITELAPRFKAPYKTASVLMSIFTGDTQGAEKILLKGLRYFPKDWRINFHASYLYSFELKNPERAAYYAYQAAKNGGPYWLYSYSAKHYGQSGQYQIGELILNNLLKSHLTKEQKNKVRQHLSQLREQKASYLQQNQKK